LVGGAAPVQGQGNGGTSSVRDEVAATTLTPSVRLFNVGYDSNVFGENQAQHPTGDFTATLSPALVGSLRLPRGRVRGQTEVGFVYFNEFSHLRSVDSNNWGRADFFFPVVPTLSGRQLREHPRRPEP